MGRNHNIEHFAAQYHGPAESLNHLSHKGLKHIMDITATGRPYSDPALPTTKHERVLGLPTLSYKKMKTNPISKQPWEHLKKEAITLGASACTAISSKEILVKENLAALCNGKYPCPNYGRSSSCHPHVKGPAEFREWQAKSQYSIVVKKEGV